MNNKVLILLFLVLYGLVSPAQINCGTDWIHQYRMANDSKYAEAVKNQDKLWKKLAQTRYSGSRKDGVSYEVPVVFHIIHTGQALGTSYNPSDDSIASFVDYLNKSFAATRPGMPDVNSGGVAIPISFKLAKRTDNCITTTGIRRVNGSGVPGYTTDGVAYGSGAAGASDSSIKALSRFPYQDYINIYIVTYITGSTPGGGGVAGYASLPVGAPETDGIVLRHDQVKWAITHEMGHFLGLYHTFQGSADETTCPANTDCNADGDKVCDTDPHPLLSGCPTGTNTCTGTSMEPVVYNIMNYTSCPNRFTAGQKNRMIFSLENYRSGLISSMGDIHPDSSQAAPATPTIACTPGNVSNDSNTYDMGPRLVTLANLSLSSGGYTDDGYKSYVDRTVSTCTQLAQVAELTAGSQYTITVGTGYNPEKVRGWIDYNDNGVFEAGELIISKTGSTAMEEHTAQFTVPTNAVKCKNLRMRITSDFYGAANPTACGGFSYGQAEDYSVLVGGGTPASPTVTINVTPNFPVCPGTSVKFQASVTNAGTFKAYSWQVNGTVVSTTDSTFTTSSLQNGDVVSCVFSTKSTCGTDTLVATSNNIVAGFSSSSPAPTISVDKNTGDSICSGTSVIYTASVGNAGSSPKYFWTKNAVAVGSDQPSYTNATPVTGDVIRCTVKSNTTCPVTDTATATAEGVTVISGKDTSYAVEACNSFLAPDDSTYYTSQTIVIETPNSNGCNDITTIYLTINTDRDTTFPVITCYSYLAPNDSVYFESQQIVVQTQTESGCDSTIIIELTVLGSDTTEQFIEECGSYLAADDSVYTVSGKHLLYLENQFGCDSVVILWLAIFEAPNDSVIVVNQTLTSAQDGATYTWVDCDNNFAPIPGENNQSYTAASSGTYAVIVTLNGACRDTSDCETIVIDGVNSYAASNISVYPNPSKDKFFIELGSGESIGELAVFDLLGNEVLSGQTDKKVMVVDLSAEPAGVYMLRWENKLFKLVRH